MAEVVYINKPPHMSYTEFKKAINLVDLVSEKVYNCYLQSVYLDAIKSKNPVLFLKRDKRPFRQHKLLIKDIPEELLTTQMCIEAVNTYWRDIFYIPDCFKTLEFYIGITKKDPCLLLTYLDTVLQKELRTTEFFLKLLEYTVML